MTSSKKKRFDRRSLLKGIGGAGLAGGGLVAGLTLSSNPVAATHGSLDIGDASMETVRGEVAYLAVGLQGYTLWENQDDPITQIRGESRLAWPGQWDEAFFPEDTRDVDDKAGRDWDTSESGRDGHFTSHIPNPDGSLCVFVDDDGTDELRGSNEFTTTPTCLDPETEDDTWIIAYDEDAFDRLEEDGAALPYAVNRDYGLPPNRIDAGNIPIPDEGDTETYGLEIRKSHELLNDDGDVVDDIELVEPFDLEITHLEGTIEAVVHGETAVDGV